MVNNNSEVQEMKWHRVNDISTQTLQINSAYLISEANSEFFDLIITNNDPDNLDWRYLKGAKGDTGDKGDTGTLANQIDNLVTRIFARKSPTQWGFCHVASDAYTDLAKTTLAVNADDVVVVIKDKSPNNLDLVAGGASASTKIKLRLDPVTVGVDEAHLTTHFLKVTVPTGGFKGKLILAYRSGIYTDTVDVPAGDWKLWSGSSPDVPSGFIGAFAAENINSSEIEEVKKAFFDLGAGSKPLTSTLPYIFKDRDDYYKSPDFSAFDFSGSSNLGSAFRGESFKRISVEAGYLTAVQADAMFYQCPNLTTLDMPNFDASGMTTLIAILSGCTNLRDLDVTHWNVTGVPNLSYLFANCKHIPEVNISCWDLSSLTDMAHAFNGCSSLRSIIVGNAFDNTPCLKFGSTFYGCALDQKTVDDILVSIEKAGTSNGTLSLQGGTNSAPSSVGATAKTALQGRGWTVTTNS